MRTCVACRKADAQGSLVRLVADEAGRIRVDERRRRPGRGAYVHPDRRCFERLLRGQRNEALERTLRRKVVVPVGEAAVVLEQQLGGAEVGRSDAQRVCNQRSVASRRTDEES